MKKAFDDFSKNLASGMSRRNAFVRLLTGAGALGFLSSRKVKAQKGSCGPGCLQVASLDYLACIEGGGTGRECFTEVLSPAYFCCVEECEGISISACDVG